MKSSVRWAAAAVAGLGLSAVSSSCCSAEDVYGGAEFTISSDPSAVVLFVQGHAVQSSVTHSMRLFGDGRLEVTVTGQAPVPDRRVTQLDKTAQQDLVGIAVRHGLPEWDTTRIESEKAIALKGQHLATADGYVVTVMIALETYRRGDRQLEGVVKKMSVTSPATAVEYFPEIQEFRGIHELQLYLERALQAQGLYS